MLALHAFIDAAELPRVPTCCLTRPGEQSTAAVLRIRMQLLARTSLNTLKDLPSLSVGNV
jgi:hypothetical protein